jgi:AraC-like DNA-binding protein
MDILAMIQNRAGIAGMRRLPASVRQRDPILSSQVCDARYFFLGRRSRTAAAGALHYGGFERCQPDFFVQRADFPLSVLELVAAGRGAVTIDGRTEALQTGTVFFYGPGNKVEIRTDATEPLEKYFLTFAGGGIGGRIRRVGFGGRRVAHVALFPEVRDVLESLLREGSRHRPGTPAICAALVEVLLLKLAELTRLTRHRHDEAEDTFVRCKTVIDTAAARLGDLAAISRAVGLGPSQLCRLFRRYEGTSPYRYLLHRKMTLAAERLMEPQCLVKEAAAHVGFADPYHFSRCFKQVHGVSPQSLRRPAGGRGRSPRSAR